MRTTRLARTAALLAVAALLTSCGGDNNANNPSGTSSAGSKPKVETIEVEGQEYKETLELPGGATVEALESAWLFAKVPGYVKGVRRVGSGEMDGRTIQVSDWVVNFQPRDIEITVVERAQGSETISRVLKCTAEDLAALEKQPQIEVTDLAQAGGEQDAEFVKQWQQKAVDFYKKHPPAEVDIGSQVQADTVLCVLHVPEMFAELEEKRAMAREAEALVVSAEAARDEANEEVKEKEELLKYHEQDLKNYQSLRQQNATTDALVQRAEAQRNASRATVATAKAHAKTAAAKLTAAKANVDVANAAVARVQAMEQYGKITAPFAGRITSRKVHRGTFVRSASSNSGAMPLFEITRVDKVRIVANVPSRLAGRALLGKEAVLHSINGFPGQRLDVGKLTHSSQSLDADSRSLRVEVHYTNPKKGEQGMRLERGMFGTATVTLDAWTKENPLAVVPATAMGTDDDGNSYVLVVVKDEDGTWAYQRRRIRVVFNDALNVGFEGGREAGDEEGIKPGQRVVAEYDDGLDGQAAEAPTKGGDA